MKKQNKEAERNNNSFPAMEEEVLNFWDKAKIFEKSVERKAPKGDYVFYDGPPFGTGEPHYGHILSSVSKDVVPRYWTMRGYRVKRRWGWDCHGLPIENIIEKDLGISGKKQIEEKGVAEFNEACRSRVLEYTDIWEKMVRRIGRWIEFKNSYKTMDLNYMESVWWAFKELWKKDLVYEGRKVLLYCPRCETPISNFEVAADNSYKDIRETSVYAKFKVANLCQLDVNLRYDNAYILAWTTTPWTLPGNVALAVGEKIDYVLIRMAMNPEFYILAKDRLEEVMKNKEYEVVKKIKGKDLVGLEYESLFDAPALKESGKKVYYVAAADFVTTDDGTGIVHTAVVYGEDDYNLGLKLDLPVIPALDNKGHFNETVPQFNGMYFKKANKEIVENLEERGLLFAKENISHSYPHCHRCETQLFYNAIPAWFLRVAKLKKRMLELNKNINWYPEYLKEGRFAQGIKQAPDWNISRNRYFATPMPVWKCYGQKNKKTKKQKNSCDNVEVVGSVDELKEKSGKKNIKDIHCHFINDITWKCARCDGTMKRIGEVFDCWVESGSMPFAEMHYPFENKKEFEKNFPAQFISEYISQTRAWFYVMHALSTALFDSNSFENVVTTGVILTEKGEKMSKSKKNFPDPWKVIDRFGVDALRFYLMSSIVMRADNLFFNENELQDIFRKNIMLLWNVVKFYELFATSPPAPLTSPLPPLLVKERGTEGTEERGGYGKRIISNNILDQWIMAKLNQLIDAVTESMNKYNLPRATRPITEFINDLSTWYLRRSRDRFKSDNEVDKKAALETTGYILLQLSKVMAPFTPFIAEQVWQRVTGNDFSDDNKSVHLEKWPSYDEASVSRPDSVLENMNLVRNIVELGLAKRDEANIKVRQPLNELRIENCELRINDDYMKLIKDEVNVKDVIITKGKGDLAAELDTELTPELVAEGVKREVVRFVNALRKDAGLTIRDRAIIYWDSKSENIASAIENYRNDVLDDTLSDDIIKDADEADVKKEVKVNGEAVVLGIRKIKD